MFVSIALNRLLRYDRKTLQRKDIVLAWSVWVFAIALFVVSDRRYTASEKLEIFVEDDLAKAIVKKISGELGLSKHVSIKEYGSVENCFTVLAAMLLKQDKNIDNMLFVKKPYIHES